MEHDNFVAIEDENMISCETYNSASIEFDLSDVETFMEEVISNQQTDMQAEQESIDPGLVPLRTLMDIDTVVTRHIPSTGAVSITVISESSKEKMRKRKTRGPYRRYTAHQIERLFDYVIEQAQHYIKRYNDDEERRLPTMLMSTRHLCYRTLEEVSVKRSQSYRYQYPRYIDTWFRNAS
ncbi:hypothetical protein BZG36_05095 [Bifiguratus adelaidae]|uniref:Uncharacterized protein n=1 Tax=Bifiguratus adelaidae TaxID=1938954 RepID=A0A261XU59_9FUNG|nr:hypothetical protein BZG36_05095 [Bifiguratus adelaidae]